LGLLFSSYFGNFFAQNWLFLWLFSVHRNDNENTMIKPATPVFSNVPSATNKDNISLSGYAEPPVRSYSTLMARKQLVLLQESAVRLPLAT